MEIKKHLNSGYFFVFTMLLTFFVNVNGQEIVGYFGKPMLGKSIANDDTLSSAVGWHR